jgi:hypothetical protein
MPEYRVIWEIDIDAASPREAAEMALGVQRDRFSDAVVFVVENDEEGTLDQIDLLEDKS